MANERTPLHTPVGRLVSGSWTEKKKTDHQNRPIDEDKQTYTFGLAIEKTHPDFPAFFQAVGQAAMAGYATNPAIQQRITAWQQSLQGFSGKIVDGDAPRANGSVNDNTKGCFVIYFSTSMNILAANSQNVSIDPASIKRGWYADVAATVSVNGLVDNNAGLYMNPVCIRLIAEGDEILGGMSVDQALENAPTAPTQLPPGARPVGSTPSAPASAGLPGTGMPGVAPAAPVTPAATTAPTTTPDTGLPQHPDVLGGGLPGDLDDDIPF